MRSISILGFFILFIIAACSTGGIGPGQINNNLGIDSIDSVQQQHVQDSLNSVHLQQAKDSSDAIGLIAFYSFNGDSAKDESGHGKDGKIIGARSDIDRNGNLNACYSFDGTEEEQYISANIGILNSITFNLWVSVSEPSTFFPNIFTYGGGGNKLVCEVHGNKQEYIDNGSEGNLYCYVTDHDSVIAQIDTLKIIDNDWHNLTVSFIHDDGIYLWLDGRFITSTPYSFTDLISDDLFFGRQIDDNAGGSPHQTHFKGSIDDIRIFSRKLTDSEILKILTLK